MILYLIAFAVLGYALAHRRNWRRPPAHGRHLYGFHYRADLAHGPQFVYCPVGNIVSWHPGDYEHKYCPYCRKGFRELT